MESNQIIAALQIDSYEVRIIVGQYYRDRFDVIAKESSACSGIDGIRIYDQTKVIETIRTVVDSVSVKLMAPLEKVLLVIPAYRYKKEKRIFERTLVNSQVEYDDVKQIFKEAYKANVGHDYEIINAACAYYKINGIAYPKIPLNEKSDNLTCEVDLICGDRLTSYDYVSVVEKAGLKIIDICQDSFASSKEAALFEQSFNCYMINMYLEGSHTVFSLICNGRVVAGFNNIKGYDELIKPVMSKYNLSYKDGARLLFRYALIGQKEGQHRVISRWHDGQEQRNITYNDLQETIYDATRQLIEECYEYCSSIINYENVSVLISGPGAALQQLDQSIQARFNKPVKAYCPDMIGVREAKWTALLGMLYVYKDNKVINGNNESSVDMNVYKEHLLPAEPEKNSDINRLSNKFKVFTDKLFVEKK